MNTAVSSLPVQNAWLETEMRRVFEAQRETALRWRTSTAKERAERIRRLRDAVLADVQGLYAAARQDFGKPEAEVDLAEVIPVLAEASAALRGVKRWMKPRRVWPTRMTLGTRSWIQYEPKGRCLIVSPWNYPINLTFSPLISCLAAGNTAVLKPSEMTPNMSAWMVKIVRQVFAENEVAIFEGDATAAQALLDLPFDHIFFTGSPAIGKVVMAAAAKHLASVTLELGGKSPTIIDETADLKLAAATLAWGKYTNLGQTCIAPDYIYVQESVKDAFVAQLVETLKKSYGTTAEEQARSPSLCRMVNERHYSRVQGILDDARSKGAKVVWGGSTVPAENFIAPTLVQDPPPDARIMQEEIFGPLLPILGFRDIDEAITQVNRGPKPLALYVWSRNEANIERVLKNTSSGGACVNHAVIQYGHGNLPFGGVNNSGIGSAHGWYGFCSFSHERAVVRTQFMLASQFFPPYTAKVRKNIQALIQLFKWF